MTHSIERVSEPFENYLRRARVFGRNLYCYALAHWYFSTDLRTCSDSVCIAQTLSVQVALTGAIPNSLLSVDGFVSFEGIVSRWQTGQGCGRTAWCNRLRQLCRI